MNPINVSTQSRCQSGQSVEMTTTRKGHGSAQTVSVSSQPEIDIYTGPPRTPCIKGRRLTGVVVNKHQKVEVKVNREVNNRNPRIDLRYFLSANTPRNHRKSGSVLESKRANRPRLSSYTESERVGGVTF